MFICCTANQPFSSQYRKQLFLYGPLQFTNRAKKCTDSFVIKNYVLCQKFLCLLILINYTVLELLIRLFIFAYVPYIRVRLIFIDYKTNSNSHTYLQFESKHQDEVLYCTGDYVKMKRENGCLYYEGRCDSQIKVRGQLVMDLLTDLNQTVDTLYSIQEINFVSK